MVIATGFFFFGYRSLMRNKTQIVAIAVVWRYFLLNL